MMQRLWAWLVPLAPVRLTRNVEYWWTPGPPPPDAAPGARPYGMCWWPYEDEYGL